MVLPQLGCSYQCCMWCLRLFFASWLSFIYSISLFLHSCRTGCCEEHHLLPVMRVWPVGWTPLICIQTLTGVILWNTKCYILWFSISYPYNESQQGPKKHWIILILWTTKMQRNFFFLFNFPFKVAVLLKISDHIYVVVSYSFLSFS